MFSGWGIRTLSTDDSGFNPIGYHLGTVWPHDSAFVAYGLARYGFRDEANKIALALLDAAAFSELPPARGVLGLSALVRRLPRPVSRRRAARRRGRPARRWCCCAACSDWRRPTAS